MPRPQRLSPIIFNTDEAEALLFGLLCTDGDDDEAGPDPGVKSAIKKILKALPPPPSEKLTAPASPNVHAGSPPHLPMLQRAIEGERKLHLRYTDKSGAATERIVWPIDLDGDALIAKCELRNDFRQFRLDRIKFAEPDPACYPIRRLLLLATWRVEQAWQT